MPTRKTLFLVFSWITLAIVSGVNGQDSSSDEPTDDLKEILQGHSQHGEAFNKGPRQKAYLIGSTGNVSFTVTCNRPEVQTYINQGLGQLHGFWDLEAERTFRQAIAMDPDCAMAYWGAALATTRDQERSQGFIAKAMERKEEVTPREQMYIEAVNKYVSNKPEEKKKRASQYLKDLESIVLKYPDDLEAKALVVHRIWENGASRNSDRQLHRHQRAVDGDFRTGTITPVPPLRDPLVGLPRSKNGVEIGCQVWHFGAFDCPHVAHARAHLLPTQTV